MNLHEILSILPEYSGVSLPLEQQQMEVSKVCVDSRQVESRSVFIAIRGSKFDSHNILNEITNQNPLALIVEDRTNISQDFRGIVLVVKNTREALDKLSSRFFSDPSHRQMMFGVTGTNGKTSCTYLFEHIFNSVGFSTGVIGTINHHLGSKVWASETTTPGPIDLQGRLAEMRDLGAKAVAMEVSSHALDQHRADSVHFNVVLFTNLTLDHMDYHHDMKKYFAAKQRLFTELLWKSNKIPQFAIVNIDDPNGKLLRVAGFANLWTYGQSQNSDFQFQVMGGDFSSTEFQLRTPFGDVKTKVPLCGLHNIYNVVGVLAATAGLGIPVEYGLRALQNFSGVPGRLQRAKSNRNLHVFIDYAHTPDALENVLQALQKVRKDIGLNNRIITLFGCGGDRDKGKRPEMAKVAEKYSDFVMVTSDNPRTENPMSIISDIMTGFKHSKPHIESDRRSAIAATLHQARDGDVVLIAGKGHEDYQIIGNEKIHFSDLEVVQEMLS